MRRDRRAPYRRGGDASRSPGRACEPVVRATDNPALARSSPLVRNREERANEVPVNSVAREAVDGKLLLISLGLGCQIRNGLFGGLSSCGLERRHGGGTRHKGALLAPR